MRIALGADHAGFPLKEELARELSAQGHDVRDLGTASAEPVDYPDFAEAVGLAVVEGRVERGIVLCGSGVGASVAANKVPGVRAALCADLYTARMSREHNDANVLVLGGRLMGADMAADILQAWLETDFAAGRHARRVAKIADVESRHAGDRARP